MLIKLSSALEVGIWEMFDFGHKITYNTSDFKGSKQFGIPVLTSKEFLEKIEGI